MPCIDSSSKEKKFGRTSGGRRQCLGGFGISLMVGGFVINSVDDETHKTPAGAGAFEGPSEIRDERGRFTSKSKIGKQRSGTDRTKGISDWRAKRKLEFPDENEPPTKRETRASKVRVWLTEHHEFYICIFDNTHDHHNQKSNFCPRFSGLLLWHFYSHISNFVSRKLFLALHGTFLLKTSTSLSQLI